MNVAEFEAVLKRTIGLDAGSIGASAVRRAVTQRMSALGIAEPEAYAERVRGSEAEVQALIETIVVPETWFFRDREAFAALAQLAREEALRGERMFRVLSLPCSTGEEPYTIAMTLLDAGLPPARFRVDAIDVSLEALERARAASYGKNSFRGADLEFRGRHFTPVEGRWSVTERVRGQVNFERGNILDPAVAAGREPYDAVFCRNLLIYFDRATQDASVDVLVRLLHARGMLFVGPSETGLILSHGLEPVRVPLAFAFRKPAPSVAEPAKTEPAPVRRREPPPRPPSTAQTTSARGLDRPMRAARPAAPPKPKAAATPTATGAAAAAATLDEIARLANAGRFDEAARRCEEHLRVQGASAKALFLLGVVRDATGRAAEAADLYRKALYLEPNHHEALLHLSYLLEAQGDAAGAQMFAARARRVAERKG
jgi:chemotaxis protein methyltransferase WspC